MVVSDLQKARSRSIATISVYIEEDGENPRFGRFPYIPLTMVSSYFVSVLGRETLEDHSQLSKRVKIAALGRLQAFRMYGGIGMSTSSLHRESTDPLIRLRACNYFLQPRKMRCWDCVTACSHNYRPALIGQVLE